MQRVHTLPGATYSNPQQRGDYRSEKNACLTLKELERWLAMDICTLYHGSVHRSLDTAPLVAWEHAVESGVIRSLPQDPRRFLISFLPVVTRIPQHDGVHLWHLRYWSDTLPTVSRPHEPVLVRYDPRNISKVYVRGPRSDAYIDVNYADLRWPAVSLFELNAARAELRRRGTQRIKHDQLFATIKAERVLVNQAQQKKKEARRAITRRPLTDRLPPSKSFVPSPAPTASSIDYSKDPETYETETWEDRR